MKRILLLFVLSVYIINSQAQETFQHFYFSRSARYLAAGPYVAKTSDGGTISANVWYAKSNNSVLQLVKLGANGTPTYLSNIAMVAGTYIMSIVQCADGGYAIIGGDGTYPGGILVYKTNANGDLVWSNRYTKMNNYTYSYDAIIVGNNIIITGYGQLPPNDNNVIMLAVNSTSGNMVTYQKYSNTDSLSFGQTQLIASTGDGVVICSQVGADALLFKINLNKKIAWAKKISLGSYSIKIRTLIKTADGGFAIGGSIYEGGNVDYARAAVIKLNSTGNAVWTKELTYPNEVLLTDNAVYAITENTDGSLITGGKYDVSLQYNQFITKLNANGSIIWTFVDNNYEAITNIFKAANNHFLVCGTNTSFISFQTPFITNFNADGSTCNENENVTCTVIDHIATATDYTLKTIDITANITQSAYSVSTTTFGHADSVICSSSSLAKHTSTDKIFTASVTPNVVLNNVLNLQIKSNINTDANIVIKGVGNNILYQTKCNITSGATTKSINLPSSTPGFYFVQITAGNQQQLLKFYKQ